MMELRHPRLVKLLGAGQMQEEDPFGMAHDVLFTVQEFMDGGSSDSRPAPL